MEWSDVLNYLQAGENSTTKFFTSIRSEDVLGSVIVGLYNAKGGCIFVGLDVKNFHLIGTNIDQNWVDSFVQAHCTPFISVRLEFIHKNDKTIVCMAIPEGIQKPAYYKNQCYRLQDTEPYHPLLEKVTTPLFQLIETPKESICIEETELSESPHIDLTLLSSQPDLTEETLDLDILTTELLELSQALQTEEPLKKAASAIPELKLSISKVSSKPSLNSRQNQVLHYLKDHPQITNKNYRALYKVSHKTAHLELVDLVAKGYLVSQGAGRNTAYVLS